MNRSEQAKELFLSGHNCAQSVVISFAEDLKFSKELALKMAAGLGEAWENNRRLAEQ